MECTSVVLLVILEFYHFLEYLFSESVLRKKYVIVLVLKILAGEIISK